MEASRAYAVSPNNREARSQQLLHGWAARRVVPFIHGSQQTDIFCRIPMNKALYRPLTARHAPRLAILVNEPRELLPGIPAHLFQIAADEPFVGLRESEVLKPE